MTSELRVTAGPLRGAAQALSGRIFVGHSLRNDVVLRDPAAKGVRLSFELRDDAVHTELMSGEIQLHGEAVAAPRSFLLPPLTPIGIGDNIIAIGASDDPHWPGCARLSAVLAGPAGIQEPAADPWQGLPGWLRVGRRKIARRSAAISLTLAVLLGGTAMAAADGFAPDDIDHGARLSAAFAANGFSGLDVRENIEGDLVVDGFVASHTQLSRVADLIEATGAPASTQIECGETVADEVAHVLRINGVMAETAYRGDGKVEAMGFEAPRSLLPKLRRAVMDDVPAVEELILTPDRLVDGVQTVMPHDPGKRVATVVAGPRGYIVTDDGARYFAGASLPTGDELVAVSAHEMVLERAGV
ncbi:MAG: hypothetical protein AAGD40_00680, partial [Pseudomonadota bacterium]